MTSSIYICLIVDLLPLPLALICCLACVWWFIWLFTLSSNLFAASTFRSGRSSLHDSWANNVTWYKGMTSLNMILRNLASVYVKCLWTFYNFQETFSHLIPGWKLLMEWLLLYVLNQQAIHIQFFFPDSFLENIILLDSLVCGWSNGLFFIFFK